MHQKTLGTKTKLNIEYGEKNSLLFGVDYFKQNAELKYSDYKLNKDADGNIIKHNGKSTYKKVDYSFDYERYVKALYFMNIYKYKNFDFTQGVRHDVTDWSFDKKANDGSGKEKDTRKNQNYELSVGWNYRDTGKIYTRYERGFTGPDGIQISDRRANADGSNYYTKTNAEDEVFDIYEIGLRDYIFGSAINLTGFMTSTDNQLSRPHSRNANGDLEYKTVNYLKSKDMEQS